MDAEFYKFFGYTPRQFQKDVATSVLTGTPTVLRAPTGYGKTAAAQFPFFLARHSSLDFPRQMLYSLPLRVLANSLHKDAVKKAQQCGLGAEGVRLQTGEFSQDNLFLGDLTFTTYDQLLAGFLHIPLSLPFRMANVLAGAAVSSYLTFDEVHLMEMERAFGTTVAMLQWLRGVTPALLMTATLTNGIMEWLEQELNARIIQLPKAEIEDLPRVRQWHRQKRALNAADVLQQHHAGRTIIVANTVGSAQRIYLELRDAVPSDTKIILLHSRFFQAHRRQKEEHLLKLFGKGATEPAILVATQVIEVGLDISCDNLHTELAPANSLIQRAGRCARFEDESGNVWVYDVEGALPYTQDILKATNDAESALWELQDNGEAIRVGYADELQWVEDVHGDADKAAILAISGRRARLFEVISKGEMSAYEELVRKVDTLTAVISPIPEATRLPWDLEGLSLRPSTVKKHFPISGDNNNFVDEDQGRWFAKKPRKEELEIDAKLSERRQPPRFEWLPIVKANELDTTPFIALNPRFVSYSFDIGLRFEPDDLGESGLSPCIVRREREKYSYQRETYLEHITQVWKACQRHFLSAGRLAAVGCRIEGKCGLKVGDFERLLCLVVALHDVGKLGQGWQNAVWGYQLARWHEQPSDFLAHTHYNPADKLDRSNEKQFPRPPHAAEGATLTQNVWESLGFSEDVCYAAFSAIARHHAPRISSVSEQRLAAGAEAAIVEAANAVGLSGWHATDIATQCKRSDKLETSDWLLKPDDAPDAYLLHLLLVRALRISDQFSFAEA